jgi:hypothetical protein
MVLAFVNIVSHPTLDRYHIHMSTETCAGRG